MHLKSELTITNCCKLPNHKELVGPVLILISNSGLEAYDKRDVVIGMLFGLVCLNLDVSPPESRIDECGSFLF